MVALWPMFIGVLVVDFGWWGQSRCLVNGGIVEDTVKTPPKATSLASARLASARKRRWLQASPSPAPIDVPVPTLAPTAEPSTALPLSPPTLSPQPTPPPTPSPQPTPPPTPSPQPTPPPTPSPTPEPTPEPTPSPAEAIVEPTTAPVSNDDIVDSSPAPSAEPPSTTTGPPSAPTSDSVKPTPAPTALTGPAGQLSGSIRAPTVALMNVTAASSLEDTLASLLFIEDQENAVVTIQASSTSRRLLSITSALLGGGGGGGAVQVRVGNGSNSGRGSKGLGGVRRCDGVDDVAIGVGQNAEGQGKLERFAAVALAGGRIGGQELSQNLAVKDEGGATGGDEAEALTVNTAETAAAAVTAVRSKGLRNRHSSPEAVDYRGSGSGGITGSVDGIRVGDGGRHLADSEELSVAEFTVDFIDDTGEQSAAARGVASMPRLLNGTSVIAAAIGLTESEISFDNLVYSSTTTADVLSDEALATFSEGGDGASGTSITIAAAFILAALIASACIGAVVGRCWLHKERERRDDIKAKLPPQPAYERSALGTPGENGTSGAAGDHSGGSLTGRPLLRSNAGVPSSSTEESVMALGRLVPPVAAGGRALHETNGVPRRGNNIHWLCEPSESSSPSGQGVGLGSGLGVRGVASGEVGEILEHDYGDEGGRTESFVSRGDGIYSEFDGQSENGSVVPGGQIHDDVLSDGGSSRFYFDGDQDQSVEWDTDVGSVDQGSFAGFPLRKDASSRFSAGPKSQASFAASGGSTFTGRSFPSRTNFPPPGGLAGSPPYGAGGRAVKGGGVGGGSAGSGFGAGGSALDAGLSPGSGLHRDEGVMRGKKTKQNEAAGAAIADGAPGAEVEMRGSLGRGGSFKEGRPPRVTFTGSADGRARGVGAAGSESGGDVEGRPSVAELAAAAAAATSETEARGGGNSSGGGGITGRPSMDSAAGSVAMSSVAHALKYNNRSNGASPPGSIVGGALPKGGGSAVGAGTGAMLGGRGGAAAPGVAASVAGSVSSGRFSIPGKHDDDAASQYAGSSVASERIHSAVDDTGSYVGSNGGRRPPLHGPGSGLGRNSQSIGGMTPVESSLGSDRESFVSRVGSYALTDIGTSDRDLVGSGGGGRYSPTSTAMRSTTGMSELDSENSRVSLGSPLGSEGGYNSDSPGAQSGWERAWMRQRTDARHLRGEGKP